MCLCVENLGIAGPDYYCYLNQSGAYTVDGMDDVKEFRDTLVRSYLLYNMQQSSIICL